MHPRHRIALHIIETSLSAEFGNIITGAVYKPPSGSAGKAAARIAECAHEQLQRTPAAPIFFLGDFNHCKPETALSGFEQYVICRARYNRILDKCYSNIKGAYSAKSEPPLCNSDHNTIHLIPSYKSIFKSCKPVHKTVNVSIETLKGCFLCTDWSIFHSLELDEATDTINDYMKFCIDNVAAKKEVVIYPNNKPYITKEIKESINRKKQAFRNKDRASLKVRSSKRIEATLY